MAVFEEIETDVKEGLPSDQILSKYIGRLSTGLINDSSELTQALAVNLGIPASQHLIIAQISMGAVRAVILGLTLKLFPDIESTESTEFRDELTKNFLRSLVVLHKKYSEEEIKEMTDYLSEEKHVIETYRRSLN